MVHCGQEKTSGLDEEQATGRAGKELEQHQIQRQAEQHKIPRQPEQYQSQREIKLELVLLRHGHTKWNKEHRYLGSTDLPLLPEEREKLAALREQPELSGSFWRVYCSDLLRCRETLACIAPSLEAQAVYDSRLRETCFGEWEGCTYEQLKNNPLYRSWIDDPAGVMPPGGEAWEAFTARLEQFVSGLVHEAAAEIRDGSSSLTPCDSAAGMDRNAAVDVDTNADVDAEAEAEAEALQLLREEPLQLRVLIVTHGGVIRQWLAQAEPGMTFYTAAAPPPGTVAVLQLLWQAGGWAWKGTGA